MKKITAIPFTRLLLTTSLFSIIFISACSDDSAPASTESSAMAAAPASSMPAATDSLGIRAVADETVEIDMSQIHNPELATDF